MLPFQWLWGTKYGRYALGAIAVLALAIALRAHFIHQGEERGKQQAAADLTQKNEEQRKLDRAAAEQKIGEANAQVAEADRRFAEAVDREAALARTIGLLATQRQTAARAVGALPDKDVHAYTVKQLNDRVQTDMTQGFTAVEERHLAQIVTDYPLLVEQNGKQQADIAELRGGVAALSTKVDGLNKRYDALETYTEKVEGYYVQAYNSVPRRRNWLLTLCTAGVKGKPKKIALPDPTGLKRP